MDSEQIPRIKVLFYAVNGLGLGHLTRMMALWQGFSCLEKYQIEPFFLTTSHASNLLCRYKIPYVQFPSKSIVAQNPIWGYRAMGRLYQALVNDVYDQFRPQVLIVDTFVLGSHFDLASLLRFGNVFKVYVHRARKQDAYDLGTIQAQRFYDLVVAPHYRGSEIIPMPVEHEVPLYWGGPLFFTGNLISRDEVRRFFNVQPAEQLILVTLGGGGDTSNGLLFEEIIQLIETIPNTKILLGRGPLEQQSFKANHHILETHYFPLSDLYAGVDWAISAAGYNAFHELLNAGVATIFIPRQRGLDDQHSRAKRAAECQAAYCLNPEQDTITQIKTLIPAMTDSLMRSTVSQNARQYILANHAPEIAQEIIHQYEASQNTGN